MAANRPNIVFILIDDMGWRDLGCYGSEFYETPNIDRLAGEGMQFSDAYAACPVCSPTRASILTGKYPARLGITNYIPGDDWGKLAAVPYTKHLPLEEVTVARALKEQAGYRTYHVGKWHLGGEAYWPEKQGFDVNVAGCDWGAPMNGYFSPWNIPTLENGPDGEYLNDRLTDEAIKLIETNGDEPFFLYFPTYVVHTHIEAKANDVAYFQGKAKRLGLDAVDPFEIGEHFAVSHKRDQHIIRRTVQSDCEYAAMIKALDTNIGRLLDTLERTGNSDDTIVIFTSDNGGLSTAEGSPTCNAPLAEGMGWMYEGGTREPLMVRWPGKIAAGSTCDVPVTSTDFYPTFLEAASAEPMPEQHCDGVSILPLLTKQTEGGVPGLACRPCSSESSTACKQAVAPTAGELTDRPIYWHYPHYGNQGGTPGSSVRQGDWKLIEFFEDDRLELYNLRDDLSEDHNLAAEHPDITVRLHGLLTAWRESVEAAIPQRNPDWAE